MGGHLETRNKAAAAQSSLGAAAANALVSLHKLPLALLLLLHAIRAFYNRHSLSLFFSGLFAGLFLALSRSSNLAGFFSFSASSFALVCAAVCCFSWKNVWLLICRHRPLLLLLDLFLLYGWCEITSLLL